MHNMQSPNILLVLIFGRFNRFNRFQKSGIAIPIDAKLARMQKYVCPFAYTCRIECITAHGIYWNHPRKQPNPCSPNHWYKAIAGRPLQWCADQFVAKCVRTLNDSRSVICGDHRRSLAYENAGGSKHYIEWSEGSHSWNVCTTRKRGQWIGKCAIIKTLPLRRWTVARMQLRFAAATCEWKWNDRNVSLRMVSVCSAHTCVRVLASPLDWPAQSVRTNADASDPTGRREPNVKCRHAAMCCTCFALGPNAPVRLFLCRPSERRHRFGHSVPPESFVEQVQLYIVS